MKELLQKKTIKIGIAVIILAVAVGIISINARSAQRQREYDGHVEAAEKYLTELDYEQAIAEYTLALEIEPNDEEVLNALEQTYLDYAQSLADAGDYEKAVSVLEEGYAQTGRERLREKKERMEYLQTSREEMKAQALADMQQMFELMAAGDYDGARRIRDVCPIHVLEDEERKYIYIPGAGESLTGIGIGSYGEGLFYGSYVDGRREGNGVYIRYAPSSVTVGEWRNDLPNGEEEMYASGNEVTYVAKGIMIDGLWDGWVEQQWTDRLGVVRDISFAADHGVIADRTEEYLKACMELGVDEEQIESDREFFSEINEDGSHFIVAAYVIEEKEIRVRTSHTFMTVGIMGYHNCGEGWGGYTN